MPTEESSKAGEASADLRRSASWPTIGDVYSRRLENWVVIRKVTGMNGLGCPWAVEDWDWPDGKTCRTNTLTLTRADTLEMIKTWVKH